MASSQPQPGNPVNQDTIISVRVVFNDQNRRFKVALRDLGAHVLPNKLRHLLSISEEAQVSFERFSDSAGAYIPLDSDNPAVYKQLYRAAKAKLKLRLRVNVISPEPTTIPSPANIMDEQPSLAQITAHTTQPLNGPAEFRQSYLDTVLSYPPPPANTVSACGAYAPYRPPTYNSAALAAALGVNNATNDTLVPTGQTETLPLRPAPSFHDFPTGAFCIDCNNCGKSIPNEHYHCSICDAGDFDLCQSCVDRGVTCEGAEHWLIKRAIRGGMVIPSVTETIAPKKASNRTPIVAECKESVSDSEFHDASSPERTCNSCIRELPEHEFVTCKKCPDFDLCFLCFVCGEHGHHPGHEFQPVADDAANVTPRIASLCSVGRGVVHQAICDGCDKNITGVRHKCLSCPDWDFCATCHLSAEEIHPGHRFAALYEPISDVTSRAEVHRGIYCDGPLCAGRRRKSYIRGDRFKCAVCHDTDFCANCEAVPTHDHNPTHPLIKFKTPVRHVSVTTLGENQQGVQMAQMGDHPRAKNAATETVPTVQQSNAATQVQTVAEVKPVEMLVSEAPQIKEESKPSATSSELQACFECDSTPDGTKFGPNRLVSQSWTMRNPGPNAWPAGCAVCYIGGDDMRNLDANHPSSVSAMTLASRSNVLEHSVEPNKTAVFKVLLRSPTRAGQAVSYWRLKTAEGVPFGHKVWVDITVTPTLAELPEQQPISPVTTSIKSEEADSTKEAPKSEESPTMIFPKLEHDSPVSSVHDVATAAAAAAPTPAQSTTQPEEEWVDEVETPEWEDDKSEDGFTTEDDYDVVDASDEDFFAEAQKAVPQ